DVRIACRLPTYQDPSRVAAALRVSQSGGGSARGVSAGARPRHAPVSRAALRLARGWSPVVVARLSPVQGDGAQLRGRYLGQVVLAELWRLLRNRPILRRLYQAKHV